VTLCKVRIRVTFYPGMTDAAINNYVKKFVFSLCVAKNKNACLALSRRDNWNVVSYDCQAELAYVCQTGKHSAL
jgi:hypothetical protein